MPTLIISNDTYTGILNCISVLLQPNLTDVVVISRDDTTPIAVCPNLCFNAICEQRKHDLTRMGKILDVHKILHLNQPVKINWAQVMAQLSLMIALSNITEVYCPNQKEFVAFAKSIVDRGVKVYYYNTGDVVHALSDGELLMKQKVFDVMIGKPQYILNIGISQHERFLPYVS